jgi:hypothetical protein
VLKKVENMQTDISARHQSALGGGLKTVVGRAMAASLLAGLAWGALSAGRAEAAIQQYDTRATWQAAAGPLSGTESFSSFTTDTPFRITNGPVAIVGGSLVELGPVSQTDGNFIDVAPFGFGASVNGSTDAVITVDNTGDPTSDTKVQLTFNTPVRAWGADFGDAAGGDILAVDVFNTSGTLLRTMVISGDDSFLGFVGTAGEAVKFLQFKGSTTGGGGTREYCEMDDMGLALVPEPGSALALALAGVACVTRCAARTARTGGRTSRRHRPARDACRAR